MVEHADGRRIETRSGNYVFGEYVRIQSPSRRRRTSGGGNRGRTAWPAVQNGGKIRVGASGKRRKIGITWDNDVGKISAHFGGTRKKHPDRRERLSHPELLLCAI